MKHPIEIYQGADGQAQVEVRFGQETVRLSLQQMDAEQKITLGADAQNRCFARVDLG